jgi:predicted TIM-barrel fold metal-dependent hydrolase
MEKLVNRYKVIDADTHIIEPYDLWTSRISVKKYGDLVPHVRWDEDAKEDAWYFGEERTMAAAGAAMAGWHEFPPNHPKKLADVDPALWDANARLKRMDEYGIFAQILYPNVAGFGAGKYLGLRDPELMLACVRAYNDWAAEWASADPRRLIPQMALPFWDLKASLAEMERAAKLGHKGVMFTYQPEYFSLPTLTDPHWDPMWAAAQSMGMPIDFHIAAGDMFIFDAFHASVGRAARFSAAGVLFFLQNAHAVTYLTTSGICHRFPKLNFVSVESGIGWLPFLLEALDWQWKNCGGHKEHPEYELLPSEYFKRQIFGCFWFEKDNLTKTIEAIGPDNILYETDFPHPTSMSPGPASYASAPFEYIERNLAGLSPGAAEKILHGNAAKIYHLD